LIALQFILTYVPGLNHVFGMAGMKWWQWFVCIGIGLFIFIVCEFEKWLRRLAHKWSSKKKSRAKKLIKKEEEAKRNERVEEGEINGKEDELIK
jgi:phosphotransferase system  glucose/maltose/N-acetylglucosamine-specific IIC component